MELLLEEIDVRCFRRGTDEKEFVSRIDETNEWAADRTVPIRYPSIHQPKDKANRRP
jgi:hypothetical protein